MTEFPSGTVTLLFTDIEGSTALLKQLGENYGATLATHQRLLREAFAAHGGHEVDTGAHRGLPGHAGFASGLTSGSAPLGQLAQNTYRGVLAISSERTRKSLE